MTRTVAVRCLALAALAAVWTISSAAPAPEPSIAVVNGEPIPLWVLESRLAAMHSTGEAGTGRAFELDRLVFRVVNDKLLAMEARALGMEQEDPTASQMASYRKKLLLDLIEAEQIKARAEPSEEEILARFRVMYQPIDLCLITMNSREEAEALMPRIEAGEDMEALARENSIDPYAARGGKARDLARRDLLVEIAEIAFALEPGQIGGPVRNDLGWSIFRVERLGEADPERFEGAKGVVQALLRQEKAGLLRETLTKKIRNKFPVVLRDKALAEIEPERAASQRLTPRIPDRNAVVATIGDSDGVTAGELGTALLSRWSSIRNEDAARAAIPIILDRLIQDRLMMLEAESLGYLDRPEVRRSLQAKEDSLLVQRYLEEVVAADLKVSGEEMEAEYRANKEKFRKPPRLRIGQITVGTREEAGRIESMLRDGADLGWLARENSIDRFREAGGDRGWIVPSPAGGEDERSLLQAEPGTVIVPPGEPGSFRILKITAREDQGHYTFAEVAGNIREKLMAEKFRDELDRFMEMLRERSEIKLNRELIDSLRVTGAMEEQDVH